MAITEEARRNHDALFPGHVSTLETTDPELVEVFDNWAFDEVLREGTLDARTRLIVQLAALIASQAVSEYRVMLGGALNIGVTPVEVKEIVYQAVPYVGMAKVFDFLHVTDDVLRSRGSRCRWSASPPPAPRPATNAAWKRSGASSVNGSTRCTRGLRRTSGTSSGCSLPTVSATTTRARAWA